MSTSPETKNDDSGEGLLSPELDTLQLADDEDGGESEEVEDTQDDPARPSIGEAVLIASRALNIDTLSDQEIDEWIAKVHDRLKVGMIIDGQHRVSGTKAQDILFTVSALPEAPWEELAFQFIVLNSTAKAVKESLLINIIGTSLDAEQLTKVEGRLVESGVPVPLYQGVMKIQDDPSSPFYQMLRFGIGDNAPIDARAAKSKIAGFWHKCKPYALVGHLIPGDRKSEKLQTWVASGLWYEYLRTFWSVAKRRYDSTDLWKPTMESDGTPTSRLLRTTILNLVQNAVCASMLEAIRNEIASDPDQKKTIASLLPDIQAFERRVKMYFDRLMPEFFSEWGPASKGLDGSRGPRDEFVKAVREVIENKKTIAQLKNQVSGNIIFKLTQQ